MEWVARRSTRGTAQCGARCSSRLPRWKATLRRCIAARCAPVAISLRVVVTPIARHPATSVLKPGATSAEPGVLLREFADTVSEPVIFVIGARVDLVGPEGSLQPLGVAAGTVFAMLTRTPYSALFSWFQFLDWRSVSRMPCGLRPIPPADKSLGGAAPGFEEVADSKAFGAQYGHFPVLPDDKSRVCGVNSFAQLPAFVGRARKEIAQQFSYRAPGVFLFEKGTDSGQWLAASDPDAALAVPGSGDGRFGGPSEEECQGAAQAARGASRRGFQ